MPCESRCSIRLLERMRSMTLKVPETDDPAVADVADSFAALAAAFPHIEDSAIVYSADGEIVVWNHGAEALYGYTFEEARAKDVSFLCPPEDSGDTIKLFVRALSGQSVAPRQVERIRKDGCRVRVSARATPLENARGDIFGVLFVTRDLTPEIARAQRIDDLERSERDIIWRVPDAVYVHRDGKILWANPAAAELFEAGSTADLVGRSAWDLIEPSELDKVLASHSDLMDGKRTPPVYVTRRKLSGEPFPTEGRGAPIVWEDEPATLMVVRDLSEQQRTVDMLAESEARQRDFAEISPDAMLVHVHGEIVFVNKAAVELFGAESRDVLLGTDVAERLHPDDRERVVKNWDRWRAGLGEDVIEARRLRMDGSSFDGEARFRPILWQGREAYLVVIRDVSDRAEFEAALRASDERYRQIVNVNPDGILIHTEGRIVFANPQAVSIFGAKGPGELLGRYMRDHVPRRPATDVEGFERMVDDNVLIPDRRETVARVVTDALGKPDVERLE
jgi:PAS domain S-box-containing protein